MASNPNEHVVKAFEKRKLSQSINQNSKSFYYSYYKRCERQLRYAELIRGHFTEGLSNLKVLEIGAGTGHNLLFFNYMGIPWQNMIANELLPDRAEFLSRRMPIKKVHIGDALELNYKGEFDIVFQSTVFSSIPDEDYRYKVAGKMKEMLKPGGMILWYDFIYDNPKNKDVKKVTKAQVRKYFHDARRIKFRKVTVAPPVGRKIGRLYNFFNFCFPFLRTHIVVAIYY